MKHILLILLLSSCSAANLLSRALKKDPSINITDTVTVEKIVEREIGTVLGLDTALVDNNRLWARATGQGKVKLEWELKADTTKIDVVVPKIVPPKSKTEIRQQGRTDRKEIEANKKVELAKEKTNKIVKKKELKSVKWYSLFWIGFVTCLISLALLYFLLKRYFK